MERRQFEQLVAEGIDAIPEKFAKKLNNVVIVVEPKPTDEQLSKSRVKTGYTLFGLYQGVPQNKRGNGYTLVLPDKITIFREPILAAANGDYGDAKRIVTETVWHEIAHHFGLGEGEVRRRQSKR